MTWIFCALRKLRCEQCLCAPFSFFCGPSKVFITKKHRRSCKIASVSVFCYFFMLCYFCIRQHDVNILRSPKFQCEQCLCAPFSFFCSPSKVFITKKRRRSCKIASVLVFCYFFMLCFICIRQHDVNILTLWVSWVVMRWLCAPFFLSYRLFQKVALWLP